MKKSIYRAAIASILFAMSTFGAPGDLDPLFGTNGKTTTQFGNGNSFILDTALQYDGKVLAVGAAVLSPSQFAILRYNKNGTLDTSFSDDGIVYTDFGSPSSARAFYVQPDG